MAFTNSPNPVGIKQLTNNRKKYAQAIFDKKINDVFSFIEMFAKPKHIDGKNIIEEPLKLEMDIDSFAETLDFLQEEGCIKLSKDHSKRSVEYFENNTNPLKYDLFKEHQKLPFVDISINKQNFRKLRKRNFCTKEYFFEKNKDKKTINISKWALFITSIGIIVTIIIALLKK